MTQTDILIISYFRKDFTEKVIKYIRERTKPGTYRLVIVDNGSSDGTKEMIPGLLKGDDHFISLPENVGLERAKCIGMESVRTPRFVDLDNDCLAPDLRYSHGKDWLQALHDLMDENQEYGAIALRCQIHVGAGPVFRGSKSDVTEFTVAGGSFRIMDTALVRSVGGWRNEEGQNRSEEWHICGKIKEAGRKVGYATNLFTKHLFGEDHKWGYGEYDHKHGNRDCAYVDSMFDEDPVTLEPTFKHNQ